MGRLTLRGARTNSLRSLDVEIPLGSLVVVTGPSGSGKSSLVFDTIFAEGQRRLVELLSPSSRRLAASLPRPDFDSLDGLPPTLACEQDAPRWSPYSTVASAIDIEHSLSLLFLRCGQIHCPECSQVQHSNTVPEMVDELMSLAEKTRFVLTVPLHERGKALQQRCEDLRKDGFTRLQVDGEVVELAELEGTIAAERVALQVDRLIRKDGIESRLADSLELALRLGGGRVLADVLDQEPITLGTGTACQACGCQLPALSPQLLSGRSADGRCDTCGGLGQRATIDLNRLVADESLSLSEGAITPWHEKNAGFYRGLLEDMCARSGIDSSIAWSELGPAARNLVLGGDIEGDYRGVVFDMEKRLANCLESGAEGGDDIDWLEGYMALSECNACGGSRLSRDARAVQLAGIGMAEVNATTLAGLPELLTRLLDAVTGHKTLAERLTSEVRRRLQVAAALGLSYLPTGRAATELSTGEARRLRLVELLSTSLQSVLFVLDEPTAGLHAQDSKHVLDLLRASVAAGNSLLLVEHDRQIIDSADCIIDMGPGAGSRGGQIVAQGHRRVLEACEGSSTGAYLSGRKVVALSHRARGPAENALVLSGASANNLQSVDVSFPMGRLTCVVGVSGAGKTSLLMGSLLPALRAEVSGTYTDFDSGAPVERCFEVATSGVRRSPRSTPATYTGLADIMRDLYAKLPESRARGFKKNRFSTNVAGGRCVACKGEGYLRVENEIFSDRYVACASCHGRRFDRQTLAVRYRGLDISALSELTVDEACKELSAIPKAMSRLHALQSVGLGYVRLGQPSTSLSGGELQRLVLARELGKTAEGHCVYLIDEPSVGLHWGDIQILLEALDALVERGHTVIMSDHHLDLMRACDHLLELGPAPGPGGGQLIASGTPAELALADTPTGRAIRL